MKNSVIAAALGVLPGICAATDYHVSPSGSDSNGCTASQPCREIREALTKVGPGDTILVANGQYKGFTASGVSGSAGSPVTVRATGNNAEILPTSDRADNRDNILVSFSDYFVVDGLETFNAPRAGIRVDTSHHVRIRNGTFGDNGKWGIFTNHSNFILIEDNIAFGSDDEHGIYFSNSADNPVIRGNRIYNNNANGIHMNGDLSAGGGSGVAGDGVISGALVEGNIIYNNGTGGGGGINMDGVRDSAIVNNLLYRNHASGIIAYQIDAGQGPGNLTIAHNTVDMASDGRYALQISQTTGGIVIRNNILLTRSSTRGCLAYGLLADVANVDSAYNIFGGNPIVSFNDWTIQKTLAQWQAESAGNEPGSFTATYTQLFIDHNNPSLASRNYHLKASAPARNAGTNFSTLPASDIDGDPRLIGSAPDIGADEIGGSTSPGPGSGSGSDYRIAPLMLLLDE